MPKKTKSEELARAEEALKRAEEAKLAATNERDAAERAYDAANARYWLAHDAALKAHTAVVIAKMPPATIAALRALNKAEGGRIEVPSYTKFWEGPTMQSLTALERTGLAMNNGYRTRIFVITPAGVDWCNSHPEEA